jgi:hypothetical protein
MNVFTVTMVLSGAGLAQSPSLVNLDFGSGTLAGWHRYGDGFYLTTAKPRGPGLTLGICSGDRGKPGRKGLVHREFVLPLQTERIRFHAFAVCPAEGKNWQGNENLNVVLATAGKQVIPKRVLSEKGWQPSPFLSPRLNKRAREYSWDVSGYAGRAMQIVIGDQDKRPGCYVFLQPLSHRNPRQLRSTKLCKVYGSSGRRP